MKFIKGSIKSRCKLVIDTNLLVRSFISPKSHSAELIKYWYDSIFTLLMSQDIYEEVADVVYGPRFIKYNFHQEEVATLLATIVSRCVFIETYPIGIQSRDMKDTKFLHLAIAGRADYLVTGDEDLLILKGYPDIGSLKIVNVEQILLVL